MYASMYLCIYIYRGLADVNSDGKLDQKEFSIAIHLIRKKIQNVELPKKIPKSLLMNPVAVVSPTTGSDGETIRNGVGGATPAEAKPASASRIGTATKY